MAAPTEIANSGAEVPNPTSITEIINDEIPKCTAVFDVLSTSISDPFQRKTTPMISTGSARIVGIIINGNPKTRQSGAEGG